MNREMEWVAGPPDATSEGTVTEAGIRPPELFAEYQRRVASDIAHYFPGRKRVSIPCVGCRGVGVRVHQERVQLPLVSIMRGPLGEPPTIRRGLEPLLFEF